MESPGGGSSKLVSNFQKYTQYLPLACMKPALNNIKRREYLGVRTGCSEPREGGRKDLTLHGSERQLKTLKWASLPLVKEAKVLAS